MKYRIRSAAVKDLEDIWEYTFRKWSKDQADRYHSLIVNEIEFVADNKTVGKDMGHVNEGFFVTCVKSHMIFFKRQKGIVHIIRILHQKMDTESNLK